MTISVIFKILFAIHTLLNMCYLNNIRVRSAFMRFIILCVLEKNFVHVSAGVLKQLVRAVENDECYFTVTQHTEFIGFLHQSELSLCKSDLEKEKQRFIYFFIKCLAVLEKQSPWWWVFLHTESVLHIILPSTVHSIAVLYLLSVPKGSEREALSSLAIWLLPKARLHFNLNCTIRNQLFYISAPKWLSNITKPTYASLPCQAFLLSPLKFNLKPAKLSDAINFCYYFSN